MVVSGVYLFEASRHWTSTVNRFVATPGVVVTEHDQMPLIALMEHGPVTRVMRSFTPLTVFVVTTSFAPGGSVPIGEVFAIAGTVIRVA